jgi:hypothetical protein
MRLRIFHAFTLVLLLISCANAPENAATIAPAQTVPVTATPPAEPAQPTDTSQPNTPDPATTRPTLTPIVITATAAATAAATESPVAWQDMPVVPSVSDHTREIYQRGLAMGRNPQAFAKVGDCGGTPSWFLGPFDGPTDVYRLGEQYEYLTETIKYFSGSFARESVASRPGFNVSNLFSSLWADSDQCKPNEGPLICELRVTNATFALIMMGSNDVWHEENFEPEMRRAIQDLIDRGVVPILATKADDIEQDGYINATIVKLALEYDVPLWNFWAAVKDLPNHGLQEDGVHLTFRGNRFDDPDAMSYGWPVRNLTALLALDAVWRGVTQ